MRVQNFINAQRAAHLHHGSQSLLVKVPSIEDLATKDSLPRLRSIQDTSTHQILRKLSDDKVAAPRGKDTDPHWQELGVPGDVREKGYLSDWRLRLAHVGSLTVRYGFQHLLG
jgi:hypothetical protein